MTVTLEQERRLIPTTACLRYKDNAERDKRWSSGPNADIGDLPSIDFNVQGYSEVYFNHLCDGGAVSVVIARERSTKNLKSFDATLDNSVRVVWEPKDQYGRREQPQLLEKREEKWVPVEKE